MVFLSRKSRFLYIVAAKKPPSSCREWFSRWFFPGFGGTWGIKLFRIDFRWLEVQFVQRTKSHKLCKLCKLWQLVDDSTIYSDHFKQLSTIGRFKKPKITLPYSVHSSEKASCTLKFLGVASFMWRRPKLQMCKKSKMGKRNDSDYHCRLANVVLKCGDSFIAISPSMASNKHRLPSSPPSSPSPSSSPSPPSPPSSCTRRVEIRWLSRICTSKPKCRNFFCISTSHCGKFDIEWMNNPRDFIHLVFMI